MKSNIKKICVASIMVALSTVLSFVKIPIGPLGGSVTLMSMVPITMIAIWYGVKFAVLPCIGYGVIQMFCDGYFGWGLSAQTLVGGIVFDYILAFGCVCLSGVFAKKKNGAVIGAVFVCLLRFLCHFISGCIFFKNFEMLNNPAIYSVVYNGFYMLPELIITAIGVFFAAKTRLINLTIGKK